MSSIERYDYAFDPEGDAWAARLIRRLPGAGSVLELGPGPGAMTKVLMAQGYQVTAVENDPQALSALHSLHANTIQGDLDGDSWFSELAGQRFDAVLACDVLEHLRRPEALLQQLSAHIKPLGRLVISVPNIAYAGVIAALRNGVFEYSDKGQLDRTHVRFFTRRSIEALLLQTGWIPRYWEPNRVPIGNSEFGWCWDAITEGFRQEIQSQWTEYDVYQWMVVATPAEAGHVAEAAQARARVDELREELQALKAVYAQEHASLLEHQKAFGEARQIIARQEGEKRALQQALEKALSDQAELMPIPAKRPREPGWRRLLRRLQNK